MFGATAASAQEAPELLLNRAPEERPKLRILGSAHFANPGQDFVNPDMPDMTTPRRQAEIEDVVRALATVSPTHVALEWPAHAQSALDDLYAGYAAGEREPGLFEGEQIGFRLAGAAGLDQVHAVDWNGNPTGEIEFYDWPAYAQASGQQPAVNALTAAIASGIPALSDQSVREWLREMNAPDVLAASHRVYFDIAMIGGDDQQPGANWVGHWYGRNLRIFRNLVLLADSPDDVVVAIYGNGHAYLLRQFAEESGAFELIDADQALSAAP
jgi:hypothetical protein